MVEKLFNFAVVVSLLLCIGTGALSLRNWSSIELLAVAHGHWQEQSPIYQAGAVSLGAGEGRICISYNQWGFNFSRVNEVTSEFAGAPNPLEYRLRNPGDLAFIRQQRAMTGAAALASDWHGFAWDSNDAHSNAQWLESRALTLPAWLIMLLTSLLPVRCMVGVAPRLRNPRRVVRRVHLALAYHFSPVGEGAGYAGSIVKPGEAMA